MSTHHCRAWLAVGILKFETNRKKAQSFLFLSLVFFLSLTAFLCWWCHLQRFFSIYLVETLEEAHAHPHIFVTMMMCLRTSQLLSNTDHVSSFLVFWSTHYARIRYWHVLWKLIPFSSRRRSRLLLITYEQHRLNDKLTTSAMGNANSGKKTDQTENGKPTRDGVHKVRSSSREIQRCLRISWTMMMDEIERRWRHRSACHCLALRRGYRQIARMSLDENSWLETYAYA